MTEYIRVGFQLTHLNEHVKLGLKTHKARTGKSLKFWPMHTSNSMSLIWQCNKWYDLASRTSYQYNSLNNFTQFSQMVFSYNLSLYATVSKKTFLTYVCTKILNTFISLPCVLHACPSHPSPFASIPTWSPQLKSPWFILAANYPSFFQTMFWKQI